MTTKILTHKKPYTCFIIGLVGFCLFINIAYASFSFFYAKYYIDRQLRLGAVSDLAVKTAKAKEAKKNEPVYINLPGAGQIRAIVDDYSLPNSVWGLVSKTHSISNDYIPMSLKIPVVATRTDKSSDERSVRQEIETQLIAMFSAASTAGYKLMIGSGYRSADLQATYFNSLARSVGEYIANQSIARPGQSEHQTGLAIDISTVTMQCYLDDCFANTGDGLWLADNSYKFGFILRYPKNKESITGYRYEPWHFRYVGVDLATALYESGLVFDEAWSYLEKADLKLKANGAI